jgi:hypothetical protein
MKKIRVQNAVGNIFTHDVARIVFSQFKDVAFKMGILFGMRMCLSC